MSNFATTVKLSMLMLTASLFSACTYFTDSSNTQSTASESTYEERQARLRSSAYDTPFELTYNKLNHILNNNDSVCVVSAGDYNDGVKLYKNSGKFVTEELYRNFSQYSLKTKLIGYQANTSMLQGQAQNLGCNLIAIPRVDSFLVDSKARRDMRISIQMFDVRSLDLVNSMAINAMSQDELAQGITYLVHKLYFPKK